MHHIQVVLANSTIVDVSENEHPDLYFALRGGSNNFGIVTTFTVRTFPQGPIFSAQVSYGDNQTEAVLDKVYDLYTRPDLTSDLNMGYDMYYTYSPEDDAFAMLGTQRYEQPIEAPPVFQEIDAITPMSRNVMIDSLANLASDPPLGRTR
jgi:FAD/FMN-containing dehydrogenase